MTPFRALLIVAAVFCLPRAGSAEPATVVSVRDAYVSRDADADSWSIGNATLAFTVGLDRTGAFRVLELRHTGIDSALNVASAPDVSINVAGRQLTLGSAGFAFESFNASALPQGVRLDLVFTLRDPRLRVTRSYASYTRTPVVETWTTIEATAGETSLTGLNVWQMTVPATTLRIVSGLMSDVADAPHSEAMPQFTIERRDLGPGERLALGAAGRSSEETVPWFVAEGSGWAFFGGLLWSGSWDLSAQRTGGAMRLALGLTTTTTTVGVGRSVEVPHGFFGLVPAAGADVSLAVRSFIMKGIRNNRPFEPLVTYNTWFAYGTAVDVQSMSEELDAAARLGVQLFVLDAGWYLGAVRSDPSDYTSGLGSWRADPARFPSGLRPLAEHAEALGLRFGIWVEPERVALSNVGRPGLADERWLATNGGRYEPGVSSPRAAQICLADARARQWILDRLVQLIDEVRPAYLKWDNNYWVNCNRSGHGHGSGDGNFAHVKGLYQVLGDLRSRYPSLLIENVSGGGNRLDFGMLRYTDTAWMDDRTGPSAVVRHNLEGLGEIFPPAYLLSFALTTPNEDLRGGSDVRLYLRSRMPGILGLTLQRGELDEADEALVSDEVEYYKRRVLGVLARAAGVLLTEQATAGRPAWEAFQLVTSGSAVLFAFQSDPGVDSITLYPRGLRPDLNYNVTSADGLVYQSDSGANLMDAGILVTTSPVSSGQIIVLQRRFRSSF